MANKNLLRNIVRGGISGARGSFRGDILAAQDKESARQQRNDEIRQALLDQSSQQLTQARIGQANRTNQPKEVNLTESQVFAQLLRDDPDEYVRIKTAIKTPTTEKRPTNITGAPSFNKLLQDREKDVESERDRAAITFQGMFPELLGEGTAAETAQTPEQLGDIVRGGLPDSVTVDQPGLSLNPFADNETIRNPRLESLDSLLALLPEAFQFPTGEEATALAGSTEAARQDPAVLSALLGDGQVELPSEEEIAKAQIALDNGVITQEQFDRFTKGQ